MFFFSSELYFSFRLALLSRRLSVFLTSEELIVIHRIVRPAVEREFKEHAEFVLTVRPDTLIIIRSSPIP